MLYLKKVTRLAEAILPRGLLKQIYTYIYNERCKQYEYIQWQMKTHIPLLADIFLYSYEADFIQSLLSTGKKH